MDDGIVGPETWDALRTYPWGSDKSWNLREECVDMSYDKKTPAEGPCVASLQHLLNQYGAGLPDDNPTYGPNTNNAVLQFQRGYNLKDSGVVDYSTKKALHEGLPSGIPVNPETTVHDCPGAECSVYLSRDTTAAIATASDNPIFRDLIKSFISVIACIRLRKFVSKVVCDAITQKAIDMIGIFRQAQEDNECVRLSFESTTDVYRPDEFSQASGAQCQD